MAKEAYRYSENKAAEKRLSGKFGSDYQKSSGFMPSGAAIAAVAMSVETELGSVDYGQRPVADRDDCLAALRLADDAHRAVGYNELISLDGARAKGCSWHEIGVALGHTWKTAERAARARYAALRRRFPGYDPAGSPAEQPSTELDKDQAADAEQADQAGKTPSRP